MLRYQSWLNSCPFLIKKGAIHFVEDRAKILNQYILLCPYSSNNRAQNKQAINLATFGVAPRKFPEDQNRADQNTAENDVEDILV